MQIGQKIIRLDTVDSTNNYTANLIKQGEILPGAVIMADEQTAGKGQRGAVWSSNAGENMLLSVFLNSANLSLHQQVALTHFAAVSVLETLRKIGISAQIKWPNDIFVGHRKIAGILIENAIVNGQISHSILGIGLNVNQMDFKDLSATSVKLEKMTFYAVEDLFFQLIFALNKYWQPLKSGDLGLLRSLYLDNLYLLEQEATFEDENGIFNGTIQGISEVGLLTIRKVVNGETILRNYDNKEVRFISKSAL
jgi:BirA family biotin operon repressor/biotin-[acetyl-CoA-carboxylase] ligase